MRRASSLFELAHMPRYLQVGLALTLGLTAAMLFEPEALDVSPRPHSVHSERLTAVERNMAGQPWLRKPVLAEPAADANPVPLEMPQVEATVPQPQPIDPPETIAPSTSVATMTYRGRMQLHGVEFVFVDTGQGIHAMVKGGSLEDGWRVDRITPERIEMSNPRLGLTHQLSTQ